MEDNRKNEMLETGHTVDFIIVFQSGSQAEMIFRTRDFFRVAANLKLKKFPVFMWSGIFTVSLIYPLVVNTV